MVEYFIYLSVIALSLLVGFSIGYVIVSSRNLCQKAKLIYTIQKIDNDDDGYVSTVIFKSDVLKAVEKVYGE